MAFHLGSLGFLTPFKFESYRTEVAKVLEGKAGLLAELLLFSQDAQMLGTRCVVLWFQRECGHHPAQPSEGEGGEGYASESGAAAREQRTPAGAQWTSSSWTHQQ